MYVPKIHISIEKDYPTDEMMVKLYHGYMLQIHQLYDPTTAKDIINPN